MKKTALVAGGTGLVGAYLVDYLIESKDYYEVKVIIRKGSEYHKSQVTLIEVDYDQLFDFGNFMHADVVFCCLGTTMKKAGTREQFYKVDFTYPFELAKISRENGSKQFNIITAMGANSKSMVFYNKVKGEIENAISNLNIDNINIFRPSLLLGERNVQRVGEQAGTILAKIINPFLVGKLKKYRAIRAEIVAEAMVTVSLENQKGIRIIQSDAIRTFGKN
jgi:uncharacterized protein YbjT (DUF2867 family)